MKTQYVIGDIVMMSADAIENYGFKYEGEKFKITHVATKYMPAGEFYTRGCPDGYHPGYDDSMKHQALYDMVYLKTGELLPLSLYDYELYRA